MTRYRCTKCHKEADVPCFCSCLANDGETIVEVAALPARAPDPDAHLVQTGGAHPEERQLSPDATEAVKIAPLTEYESVQAAAVFHELNQRGDPYALTRTVEHILKMRAGVGAPRLPEPSPEDTSEVLAAAREVVREFADVFHFGQAESDEALRARGITDDLAYRRLKRALGAVDGGGTQT